MTENELYIFEGICSEIRFGFNSIGEIRERIIELIEDNGFENEISEEWAFKMIDDEHRKLVEESKSWEHPTDTENLIAAFNELCQQNIIALHFAGYTTSDGEAEVVGVEEALRAKGKKSDGYCFYHEQDLERAINPDNSNLYLAFQKINNADDNITIAVGKKVVKVLEKYGFNIKWDVTANVKIELVNFRWRKLYNDSEVHLLNYNNVVEVMLNNKK